jgi:hypothetical protein
LAGAPGRARQGASPGAGASCRLLLVGASARETTMRKPPAGLENRCFIAPNHNGEASTRASSSHCGSFTCAEPAWPILRLVEGSASRKKHRPRPTVTQLRLFQNRNARVHSPRPGGRASPPSSFALFYLTSASPPGKVLVTRRRAPRMARCILAPTGERNWWNGLTEYGSNIHMRIVPRWVPLRPLPDAKDASPRTTAVLRTQKQNAYCQKRAIGSCFGYLFQFDVIAIAILRQQLSQTAHLWPGNANIAETEVDMDNLGKPCWVSEQKQTDASILSFDLPDDAFQCPFQAFVPCTIWTSVAGTCLS